MMKKIKESLNNLGESDIDKLIYEVSEYQIVSFDIFDTLIKRNVGDPTEVFNLIGKKINDKSFLEKRIYAEKCARSKKCNGEVNLDEIYDEFDIDDFFKEKYKQIEIHTELMLCTYSREIKKLFDYCISSGKLVVVISDMYLDHDTIEKILTRNGYHGYYKLYISNEIGKSKANGELYSYVIEDLGITQQEIIHIGNSIKSDCFMAKNGIKSLKIPTHYNRTKKRYDFNSSCYVNWLNSFINNNTNPKQSPYYCFGFEAFGPALYGFAKWLITCIRTDDIQQVLFLSRDGYMIKRAYEMVNENYNTKTFYFEASRRSLRVPFFSENMTSREIISELTVPNRFSISEIFEGLGLDSHDYKECIERFGYNLNSKYDKSMILSNKFVQLIDLLKSDIINNSSEEREALLRYIEDIDFSKKTAIVDIGWRGSMQKYFCELLNRLNIHHDIEGLYYGLSKESSSCLRTISGNAKGYVFDCYNNQNEVDDIKAYSGLIESLFLEQNGSVKKYYYDEINNISKVLRYDYEYQHNEEMQYNITSIQDGALDFIREYNCCFLSDNIGCDSSIWENNLGEVLRKPSLGDVSMFGSFEFYNFGEKFYLAKPKTMIEYLAKPHLLLDDFSASKWKVGFLKKMFKISFPYISIVRFLIWRLSKNEKNY